MKKLRQLMGREGFWVLVALGLRGVFAFALGDRFYQADEHGYNEFATSLAQWHVLGTDGQAQVGSPGAPFFFSLFYFVELGVRSARLGQVVLSTATAWMLGRMTRELTGSTRAGLLALSVAAVYPFFIYYSGLLMTETIYLFLTVAGLWALCASLKNRGRTLRPAALAGIALAAAGLTRTEGVPVALALWLGLALLSVLKRYSWKTLALGTLCWVLPLFGWAARNKGICGIYTLDLHGGATLLHGTMFHDINLDDTVYAQQAIELSPFYKEGQLLDEVGRDALYKREAFRFVRENPGTTVRHWLQKFVDFWRFYPRLDKKYPDNAQTRPHLGASHILLVVISIAFEPALILGGFYGAWRLKDRLAILFPIYWMVFATCAAHVVVVSQMRYRLPVMPWMIFFACAAAAAYFPKGQVRR